MHFVTTSERNIYALDYCARAIACMQSQSFSIERQVKVKYNPQNHTFELTQEQTELV